MPPAEIPRPSSPLVGWRGDMSCLTRSSQDQHHPQEISRWSKTTTESESSENLRETSPQKSRVQKKNSKRNRQSKDMTNSSPVDPSSDRVTSPCQPIDNLGMPPIAVAGPDEPRSFYDSGSDDSDDDEPVIHRASSVRVSKPHIVQQGNASGGSVPKLFGPHSAPTNEEIPTPKGQQTLSYGTKNSTHGTPSAEKTEKDLVRGGPQDALKVLEGQDSEKDSLTARSPNPAEETTGQKDAMTRTILEYPDAPGRNEALETLPAPMGGFESVHISRTNTETAYSSSTYISPSSIDGLRSNPTTENDKRLSRAISAPVRNSGRRVMIRPADLVTDRANHDHKLFRESIVSTPYPARQSSIREIDEVPAAPEAKTAQQPRRAKRLSNHKEDESEEEDKYSDAKEQNEKNSGKADQPPEIPLSTKPVSSSAPTTSKSDRFPSPVAPEILFLDLRLTRHPDAGVTVEIEITDKTTFDDEQLFAIVRNAYTNKLLGMSRRFFCARILSYASVADHLSPNLGVIPSPRRDRGYWRGGQAAAMAADIDGGDFVKHLLQPRHGRRRKIWLLWLRNHQRHESSTTSSFARRSRMVPPGSPRHAPASPVFSFAHSRNCSSGNHNDSSPSMETAPNSALGIGSRSNLSVKPSVALRTESLAAVSSRHSHVPVQTGPPTLYLHHTFSVRKILAGLLTTFFLAVSVAVMWIVFGPPGRRADQGNGTTTSEGKEYTLSWKRDAQGRVLVGLVLGILVLDLGLVTEAVWAWASWVLM
ncbi:uncharacterized protein Z518_06944 [Rhinocladiella mackenziei CBS 650.93]|uniref:Uncharacterized protein n=1 Tax=Rhinocladiella mackenziei CBS 650.93 TaxID=1442369 RepID=A0A0D2FMV5_9EURO|nr:uncharacterized protein Z518_06944 [Rhinocladiella mackenziei CBS 650.93]KIX03392.1 hypothetical protein Z518_06944 [Rhinocladiella mackenziei CBS 650.93]